MSACPCLWLPVRSCVSVGVDVRGGQAVLCLCSLWLPVLIYFRRMSGELHILFHVLHDFLKDCSVALLSECCCAPSLSAALQSEEPSHALLLVCIISCMHPEPHFLFLSLFCVRQIITCTALLLAPLPQPTWESPFQHRALAWRDGVSYLMCAHLSCMVYEKPSLVCHGV